MLFPARANVERLADIATAILSGNLVDTSNLIGTQLFAEFLKRLLIVFCPYKFTESLKSTQLWSKVHNLCDVGFLSLCQINRVSGKELFLLLLLKSLFLLDSKSFFCLLNLRIKLIEFVLQQLSRMTLLDLLKLFCQLIFKLGAACLSFGRQILCRLKFYFTPLILSLTYLIVKNIKFRGGFRYFTAHFLKSCRGL
ncbi:MAG TPA: hypothetical protein [Caudoviricetes sp.]|nr:MAG TPA: hypothetical protein [Caudoviricetes sp.]